MNAQVGLADLLVALELAGASAARRNALAHRLGYPACAPAADPIQQHPRGATALHATPSTAPQPITLARPPLRAPMLAAARMDTDQTTPDAVDLAPLPGDAPLTLDDWLPAPAALRCAALPLLPNCRQMPALRNLLSAAIPNAIDVPKLARALAAGRWPKRVPLRRRTGAATSTWLVLDLSATLAVYHRDMHDLARYLLRWYGGSALQVRVVLEEADPCGAWASWQGGVAPQQEGLAWEAAPPGTQVLLFSELGLHRHNADSLKVQAQWQLWLRRVAAQGAQVQVLSPMALHAPDFGHVATVHWSEAGRLRSVAMGKQCNLADEQAIATAELLADMASFCSAVDPVLLRALRISLGTAGLDAGLEQHAWSLLNQNKAWTLRARSALELEAARQRMQARWQVLAGPDSCQQALDLIDIIRAHWLARSPALAHAATIAWASWAPTQAVRARERELDAARAFHRRLCAPESWFVNGMGASALAYAKDRVRWTDPREAQEHGALLCTLWSALQRHGSNTGAVVDAGALSPRAQARQLARGRLSAYGSLVLHLPSHQVVLRADGSACMAGDVLLLADAINRTVLRLDGPRGSAWLQADPDRDLVLTDLAEALQGVQLHTPAGSYCLGTVSRPLGVPGWSWRDGRLHLQWPADLPLPKDLADTIPVDVSPAMVPDPSKLAIHLKRPVHVWSNREEPVGTVEYVDSATLQWQLDDFGLCLDWQMAKVSRARMDQLEAIRSVWIEQRVSQRFRYIAPGTFLMGSSGDEARARSRERPRHPVTLSQGLWLADTPCTQALWEAVMGRNPSHFSRVHDAAERPVENVSWHDVQAFFRRLQALLPDWLSPTLPTEAEWEYACRAGGDKAHALGEDFHQAKANVDYGEGALNETSAVKQYAPNAWGLYDLLGNVWEWCMDGRRDYGDAAVTDPRGPEGPEDPRVLRGGSFDTEPESARSAFRDRDPPSTRIHSRGFRFALRYARPELPGRSVGGAKAGGSGFAAPVEPTGPKRVARQETGRGTA